MDKVLPWDHGIIDSPINHPKTDHTCRTKWEIPKIILELYIHPTRDKIYITRPCYHQHCAMFASILAFQMHIIGLGIAPFTRQTLTAPSLTETQNAPTQNLENASKEFSQNTSCNQWWLIVPEHVNNKNCTKIKTNKCQKVTTLMLNGDSLSCLIDWGSSLSIIPLTLSPKIPLGNLQCLHGFVGHSNSRHYLLNRKMLWKIKNWPHI